jgi:hypothetical protein
MDWKHLLASITGTVDQELLLRNEYLVTENRILRNQINGRVRLSDGERKALAEIAQKLGKKALEEVATIVKPVETLCGHRGMECRLEGGTSCGNSSSVTLMKSRNAVGRAGMSVNCTLAIRGASCHRRHSIPSIVRNSTGGFP